MMDAVSYELLSHPSDVGFRATGATLEAAFTEAVGAVEDIVTESSDYHSDVAPKRWDLDVQARTLEALLFDYLDQLVRFQDIEDVVVQSVPDLTIQETTTGYELHGSFSGAPIDPSQPMLDVKAPTYDTLSVSPGPDGWTVTAILDI